MAKRKRLFNEIETVEILNLYQNTTISQEGLCKRFHCSRNTIRDILVQNNVKLKYGGPQIPQKDLDEAIKLYKAGNSLSKIGKILGHSKDIISKHLKNSGIEIINKQNLSRFNEHVFDIIDTEEKAYWLGFIWADGFIASPLKKGKNVGKNVFTFAISLQIDDYNHLLKFNKFMEHNKVNIRIDLKDPIRPHCTWNVRNKHLWETLNSYGCIPRKSLTLNFPDMKTFKTPKLIKHFIRGFFDGDGCLSYCSSGYKSNFVYPRCGFTGTRDMLENIDKIFNKTSRYYPCKFGNLEWNGITWSNWYTNRDTVDIINFLYKDATIYLDRKYKLYEFFRNGGRSLEEFNELRASKIGETWDGNPEVISEIAKGSETP